MSNTLNNHMTLFKQAVRDGEEPRRLEILIGMPKKEDFLGWKDEQGLDAMHHAIMANNPEAVDLLLKLGYFARPYEPEVNLYTHFAARCGLRTVLNVLLTNRPDDFRIAKQPLFVPRGAVILGGGTKDKLTVSRGSNTPPTLSEGITARLGSANRLGKRGDDSSYMNNRMSREERGGTAKPSPTRPESRKGSLDKDRGGLLSLSGTPDDSGSSSIAVPKLEPLLKNPLEVAAEAQKVDCVKLILDMCVLKANPDAPSKGYLTLAALAACPTSMNLLLKTQEKIGQERQQRKLEKLRVEDFKAAVEICVQRVRPQCLDLLLTDNTVDVKGLFKNINFYHVLYTFSATYGKGAYGCLPEVTQVLIKHRHDVKAKEPPRTYPLYTLITHSFVYHEFPFTEYYIECMKLLLQNGADPNFDEVKFEKHLLEKKGVKFAAGRNAFSSAMHCLMETVEAYATFLSSPALAIKFVEDCADVLFRYSADIERVGRIGDAQSTLQGNVLHQYAKSSVMIGVERPILRTILRYGAEPGAKVKGKYAINVYFDRLFEALALHIVVDVNHKYEKDTREMLECLCGLMTPAEIKDACIIFDHSHSNTTSEMVKPYVRMVSAELKRRSKLVRPLRGLAAWRVWKLCCKKSDIVRQLPVSVELKTLILPLVE